MLGNIVIGVSLLVLYFCIVPFRFLSDVWLNLWESTPGDTDRETSSNRQANAPTPLSTTQPTMPPKPQATSLYIPGPTRPPTSQPSINIAPDPKPGILLGRKYRPFCNLHMSPSSTIPADIFERPPQQPPQYSLSVASGSDIRSALPKSPALTPRSSCDQCQKRGMVPGYEPQTSRVEVLRVEREPKNSSLTRLGARIRLLRNLGKDKEESGKAAIEEVDKRGGMMRVGSQVAAQYMSDERGGDSVDEARSKRTKRGSVGFKRRLRHAGRGLLGLDKEMWVGAIRGEDTIAHGAHWAMLPC